MCVCVTHQNRGDIFHIIRLKKVKERDSQNVNNGRSEGSKVACIVGIVCTVQSLQFAVTLLVGSGVILVCFVFLEVRCNQLNWRYEASDGCKVGISGLGCKFFPIKN